MRRYLNAIAFAIAALCLVVGSPGCESSSHSSVRTYEYSDEPQRDRQQDDQLDSEYKMVSPGEMTGPGE